MLGEQNTDHEKMENTTPPESTTITQAKESLYGNKGTYGELDTNQVSIKGRIH